MVVGDEGDDCKFLLMFACSAGELLPAERADSVAEPVERLLRKKEKRTIGRVRGETSGDGPGGQDRGYVSRPAHETCVVIWVMWNRPRSNETGPQDDA